MRAATSRAVARTGPYVFSASAAGARIAIPTLEDLKDLELCYAPPFNTARDSVNFAGYVGLNLLHGVSRHVHVSDVRGLVESGAYIVGQLPSGLSNLGTSMKNASAFAKNNDIPVPPDVTKAMAAL